jgi:hypothetical protein
MVVVEREHRLIVLEPAPETAGEISYESYKERGGVFGRALYEQMRNFRGLDSRRAMEDPGINYFRHRAVRMAGDAHVELTREERDVFTVLRLKSATTEEEVAGTTMHPQTMIDTRLLAEVFLLTEPHKSDVFMANTYPDGNLRKYRKEGGVLDAGTYQRIRDFRGLPEGAWWRDPSVRASYHQAEGLGERVRIRFTKKEKELYTVLRTLPSSEGDIPPDGAKRIQEVRSDQRLMAEVLRITNPRKRKKYVSQNEVVFGRHDDMPI